VEEEAIVKAGGKRTKLTAGDFTIDED